MQLQIPSSFFSNPLVNTVIPFCISPTSKSTTINDPTAGMDSEEIKDYLSNVGGSLCGYPDFVKEIVGLALNLDLLVFAILSLGYIILGKLLLLYYYNLYT